MTATEPVAEDLLERFLHAYGRAMSVIDPVRIRFWDMRGLTMSQLRVMFLVGQTDSQPMGGLAEEMQVKPATVSGLVERLERQGLLERDHDRTDRRVVRVSLTPEGRRVLNEMQAAARTYLAAVLDRMAPEVPAELARLLEEFRRAADGVRLDCD